MESGAAGALARWLRTGLAPGPRSEEESAALVDAAEVQRVAPLLYAAVFESGGWPASAVDRLRRLHHAAFARGVRQLALAVDVLEALERAGVRALPLKGAALAERVYDSVAERPMADVDVLVLAVVFAAPNTGTLELHHAVASCPGLQTLDAEGLWQRSATGGGQVRRRPAPEDLLIQLALHAAFQHGLVLTLVQYLDFKRLLSRERVSSSRLRELAPDVPAAPALAASLAAADALVGLERSPELRALPLPTGLERWMRPRLAEPVRFLASHPVPLARVRWELCPGRRARLLLETLSPTPPAPRPSLPRRIVAGLARAFGLARRWLFRG